MLEIKENKRRGKPIPKPKNKKFIILEAKFEKRTALAKKAAINNGLQGITIAPKKKPKTKALTKGFL